MWTLGSILKVSVVAGLIAGAMISGFHTLLIEPYIERAIAIEEQHSQAHGEAHAEPVVDRPTQRWGLVLGFIVYGAIWGLLLGCYVPHPRLATDDLEPRAVRGGAGRAAGLVGGVVSLSQIPGEPARGR